MKKIIFSGINLLIFIAALYALDNCAIPANSDLVEVRKIRTIHTDVAIPTMTLTDEMRAGLFFERLRVDTSVIRPKAIRESINPWETQIRRYSAKYRVDPDLVRAIIYAESKGNPTVISRVGAQGLMQLMPRTGAFMGISDLLDPEENIKAGVKYIAWLIKYSNRDFDEHELLWAWNAGQAKFDSNIIPGETRKFIIEVISIKTFLKEDRSQTI